MAAARQLLRDEGVAAVTLKAVAGKIGRTHANLLHHFGSAAGLHRALAEDIAATVSESISEAIGKRRRGEASERDVVDAMFDAFHTERVGELIDGFETSFGMELLATVHWVARREGVLSAGAAVDRVYAWNDRKRMFSSGQIELAWNALAEKRWLSENFPTN